MFRLNPFSPFTLYDFFSVFLPGVVFALSLLPLVPDETRNNLTLGTGILILVISGFVLGQVIHSIAVQIQSVLMRSHREAFRDRLDPESEPSRINQWLGTDFEDISDRELLDRVVADTYDYRLNATNSEFKGAPTADTFYRLMRSLVSIDGRGRSRNLQAIFGFSRS